MRWDDLMGLMMYPDTATVIRESRMPAKQETCTMCGDFCAAKKGMKIFENNISKEKQCAAATTV